MSTVTQAAKAPKPKKAPKPPGIRQTMSDLHTWTGLLVGWILFAMFLTGTVSFFRDELSQWMRPELMARSSVPTEVAAQRAVDTMQATAPGSNNWFISLPTPRANTTSIFWRGDKAFENAAFDPATGERVSSRETRGGDFFYGFHFQFHYLPVLWARWLAGICAMFMLVAIVSGVITHKKIFTDFFTFRWGKGQRSWLDAHNVLSVLGLPFHAMITYTGLVTLMALYFPWGPQAVFTTPAERAVYNESFSAFISPGKPSGEAAPLASVEAMVREAQAHWGAPAGRLQVTLPGDKASQVLVARRDSHNVSISPAYLMFDGATGVRTKTVDSVGAAAETRGVLYGLHMGRFADLTMRWLYFLCSLAGTAMVGTGLVMWTVKRRQKLPDPDKPHFGFRFVERMNIATVAGLVIAMTGFLWANRLLPTGMADRPAWEIHVFFIIWGGTLVYALVRPARRAWLEELWVAVALLALLPVYNLFGTSRGLIASAMNRDWVFFAMDLGLWGLAALVAVIAIRAARHRARPRPVKRTASPRLDEGVPG